MSDFESRAKHAADAVKREIEDKTPDPERGLKRAKRSQARMAVPSTLVVIAIIAAGFFTFSNGKGGSSNNGTHYQLAVALKSFDACTDALQYFKDQAPKYYIDRANRSEIYSATNTAGAAITTTTGGDGKGIVDVRPTANALTGDASTSEGQPGSATHSTTNVQERGVDEPDTIKTDGNVIVTVNSGSVYVLSANDGHPQIKAKIDSTNVDGVFLKGTRLVTFTAGTDTGNGYAVPYEAARGVASGIASGISNTKATITTYDIGDLTNPRKVGQLAIDGTIIDARMVDSQIRVATSSTPDPDIPSPSSGPYGKPLQQSIDALPAEINATTLNDWVPQYSQSDGNGKTLSSGQLVQCSKLAHPSTFSGLDTVAITTFDITGIPTATQSVGVIASGQQLYATASNTYISSTDWTTDPSPAQHTNIHKFVTDASGHTSYSGSGEVDGSLLSSYSMSEYNGALRVATTTSGSRGWINRHQVNEGVVTVLRSTGKELQQIGKVTGLGVNDSESITAVRFDGTRGYVSTARQTDPLFVLNLSDPADPTIAGRLSIPGFTGYLQPLANNMVLGVGQGSSSTPASSAPNAITTTIDPSSGVSGGVASRVPVQSQGLQFSLFDVSDPTTPRRVGVLTYKGGQSDAQFDPHAFLYWQPRNLIIAPATVYDIDGVDQFSGLLLMQANRSDLREIGRLADTEYSGNYGLPQVNRTIVIDSNVYMLSNDNLQVDSLNTHGQIATVQLKG